MKLISLTKGRYALVDDEDYETISKYKWSFSHGYARRSDTNHKTVYMHRQILDANGGIVDHKNGEGTDNRRHNLRIADKRLNGINRGVNKNNCSGYKGVYLRKGRYTRPWIARISRDRKIIYRKAFTTALQASIAYQNKLQEIYGEFASI